MNLNDVRPLTVDQPGDRVRLHGYPGPDEYEGSTGTVVLDTSQQLYIKFIPDPNTGAAIESYLLVNPEELEPL